MACAKRSVSDVSEAAVLQVDSLAVRYGDKNAVADFSLSMTTGSCTGIIGESGAGKSQAFLAMLGLLPPAALVEGSARLGDVDLLASGARAVRGRRAAMIFQDPMSSLTPHMRIGDQVAEPLVAHQGMGWSAARQRAAELLRQVRISDVPRRMRQYPHELSGGLRQRVCIAMALACDPALLVADEPTTALDVSVQAQILVLLRELIASRALALAVITHDMGVIAALADTVVVMQAGRVVERGPVEQVLRSPRHEYTRALLAAMPRLDAELPATPAAALSRREVLAVNELRVRYRARRTGWRRSSALAAVDGVSFSLGDGESLGVVGESGCGKSTLVRAVLRLGPLHSGRVVWLGRAIESLAGEELRRLRDGMQIVFQDPYSSLDPRMSVAEIVAEPLRALRPELDGGARAVAVRAMLEAVGLSGEFAVRRSSELSGGQCQRVAIARAMILEPKLLVCDEAVSALDVSVQAQILELLGALRLRHGSSIIFVSHNLAVVRKFSDRVLVMYLGRVVECGPAAAVFAAPRHPYTRMLLDAVPLADPAAQRARMAPVTGAEPPSAFERPAGCVFSSRCAHAVDTCITRSPEPEPAGDGREVACHRWRELTI